MATPTKHAAKKAAKKKPARDKMTLPERVEHLEQSHDALLAQLKSHGIHLDLGAEDEDDENGDAPDEDENEE